MLKSLKPSLKLSNTKNNSNPPLLINGKDISTWTLIQIENIPPGPLGILLDGTVSDAAVIDRFAPINAQGTLGPIESHGTIQTGSFLVSLNEYDFIALKYSLQEVSRILRETSGIIRTLGFKIPPITKLPPSEHSETDMHGLIKGMKNSTPSHPPTKPWSLKELLSPKHQNSSSTLSEPKITSTPDSLRDATPVESKYQDGADNSVASPAINTLRTSSKIRTSNHENIALLPIKQKSESNEGSTPATDIQNSNDEQPFQPTSPKRTIVGPHQDVLVMGKTVISTDKTYTVVAPAGPLGINLDANQPDRAVVVGYLPLPDGNKGMLEQGNLVPKGSILIHINGFDVSNVPLEDVRTRLRALAGLPRELVFISPPLEMDSPPSPRISMNDLDDLSIRRKLELELILKHDESKITRGECWFLISTAWMTRWILYTSKGGPLPGPIDNSMLLELDWEDRLHGKAMGRPDATRTGMVLIKDYRGVTPIVWSLLAALHGTANMPPIARYILDINADAVVATELEHFLKAPRPQAQTSIKQLQERCPTAFM